MPWNNKTLSSSYFQDFQQTVLVSTLQKYLHSKVLIRVSRHCSIMPTLVLGIFQSSLFIHARSSQCLGLVHNSRCSHRVQRYGGNGWFPDAARGRRVVLSVAESQKSQENDLSQDKDDMFDDLLETYGKVVFRKSDPKPPIAEAEADAEALSFAVALAKVASDVKGNDIRVLFVKPVVSWTRFFIIVTAFSRPQVEAISSRMRDLAEKQYKKAATGDYKPNSWMLLDFGDVVVHVFLPEQRAYYNLEEFYGNSTAVDLPFENQSQFRS